MFPPGNKKKTRTIKLCEQVKNVETRLKCNFKPLIIPRRTPKSSSGRLKFCAIPAVFKIVAIFRVFFFTFFVQFLTLFLSWGKNAFRQQVLGLGIFPYNCLKVLEVSRKSEAVS